MMKLFRKAARKVKNAVSFLKSKFDKQGSYTGTADGPGDSQTPEQDADDL